MLSIYQCERLDRLQEECDHIVIAKSLLKEAMEELVGVKSEGYALRTIAQLIESLEESEREIREESEEIYSERR